MTAAVRRPDLHDMVRELCEYTQHRELFWGRKRGARYHVTTHPPLLVQLSAASTPKASVESGTMRPATSKPAAALDAVDTLLRIDRDAAAWLRALGQDDPGNVIRCVRELGALAAGLHHCGRATPRRDENGWASCCTYHQVEDDVRRWRSWARVTTRWDLPPWRPHNTCPLCGSRGTLWVRVADRTAMCTGEGCWQFWDEATFGLLVEHIRAENHEDQAS
jgi:hypothetical protein